MKFYKVFRKDEIHERALLRVGDIRVTDNGGVFLSIHLFKNEDYIILPDREQGKTYVVFSVKEYEVQGESRKKWNVIGELSIHANGEKQLRLNCIPALFIVLGDPQDQSEDILASGELHPLK